MRRQNGDEKELIINTETNNQNLFSDNPTDKKNNMNNGVTIEDILDNDDYVNDLRIYQKSRYKELLSSKNIFKLIHYSLQPKENLKYELQKELRYAYHSCLILCSHCVLHFSKSINYISQANKKEQEKEEETNINNNNQSFSSLEINNNYSNKTEDFFFQNPLNEESFEQMNNIKSELENEEYFHFGNNNNEIEEKFREITETEIKKTSIKKKPFSEYDISDRKIIKDILDEIFKMLCFIKKEDFTYIGYFQKIINYMLFIESDILFNYLFIEEKSTINKLYKHLDKCAIENIFENILNKLLDESNNEDINYSDKKIIDKINKNDKNNNNEYYYGNIIQELLKELTNDDYNYEKNEIICDLIINTLLKNNEKLLIYLIFDCEDDDNMIKKIYKYIQKLINKENKENIDNRINNGDNEKLLINIIQMLCQLNNVIMNSFYKSSYFINNNYIDLFIEDYKKIKPFEYQYASKKTISNEILFEAYNKNINLYLKMINDIYILIKKDIVEKEKQKKKNNNISTKNNNNQIIYSNKKTFGYFHLYEWKFIHNALKIFIYSFYAVKNSTIINKDYFNFKDLFPISIQFYFDYSQNNIYQNIFKEIIKLMCEESCPKYINKLLLKKDKNNEKNKFIFKIINNLKTEINNKYYLSIGTNIEILKIIYSSSNRTILKYFGKSKLDNKIKDIFIQSINPNLERKLLDDYEYSFSEIFNSENELNDTFDGNDIDIDRNYPCLKQLIKKFLKKYEKEKIDFINNNNKKEEVKKYEKKYNINLDTNIIKEKDIIEYEEESFEIKRRIEMKLKEEDNQINNNLSDTSLE